LYKRYKLTSTIDSPFRNIDRIKLINEIFRQPATGDVPGCGFELSRLQAKGCLLGYFPLHDMSAKISLERRWLAINTLPNQQPIEQIKDYFGEKIALYYGWIGVYTTFLGYASGAAIITYIWSAAEGRTDSEITPYFASFIALWCTVFLESWKRQEAAYRVEWGMTGFEDMETSRPSYWGFQRTLEGAQVLMRMRRLAHTCQNDRKKTPMNRRRIDLWCWKMPIKFLSCSLLFSLSLFVYIFTNISSLS
jgi:hypothetical protein